MMNRGRPRPPRPLLDRFLDQGPPENFDDYIAVILRDLEALLNTWAGSSADGAGETVLEYGLAGLGAADRSQAALLRLSLAVKKQVEIFEPRLCRVRVEPLLDGPSEIDRGKILLTASLTGYEHQPPLELELPW